MKCIETDSKMKKYIAPTRLEVHMSPPAFYPCIGSSSGLVDGKAVGRSRKKFGVGIGEVSALPTVRFEDDLTAGLVEEFGRAVDGARASLGNGFGKQPPSGVFHREAKTTIG